MRRGCSGRVSDVLIDVGEERSYHRLWRTSASITGNPAQARKSCLGLDLRQRLQPGPSAQLNTGLHRLPAPPLNQVWIGLPLPDPGHLRQGITLDQDSKLNVVPNLMGRL